MVAIRTTAGSLETPILLDGKMTVSEESLAALLEDANNRLAANFQKVLKFSQSMVSSLKAPLTLPPPSLAPFLREESKTAESAGNGTAANGATDKPVVSSKELKALVNRTSSQKKVPVIGKATVYSPVPQWF